MTTGVDPAFLSALRVIAAALDGMEADWAITGSLGFALQGVRVGVHDIDLQTSAAGAYEMERRLATHVTQPVFMRTSEKLQSYFARLQIEGVPVEIMGGLQRRTPDGRWDDPVDVAPIRRWVIHAGLHLPVLALEYEHEAYLYLGRIEKVRILEATIQRRNQE